MNKSTRNGQKKNKTLVNSYVLTFSLLFLSLIFQITKQVLVCTAEKKTKGLNAQDSQDQRLGISGWKSRLKLPGQKTPGGPQVSCQNHCRVHLQHLPPLTQLLGAWHQLVSSKLTACGNAFIEAGLVISLPWRVRSGNQDEVRSQRYVLSAFLIGHKFKKKKSHICSPCSWKGGGMMQFQQFNLVSLYAFASREYAFVKLRAEDIASHSPSSTGGCLQVLM